MKLPKLTSRQRKLLRWVGTPLALLLVFFMSLQWTFPYQRVGDTIVSKLGSYYDVAGGEVSSGFFPGNFSLSGLTLTTRPQEIEQKPEVYKLDELDVKMSVLSALAKRIKVDIAAEAGGGTLNASAKVGGGDLSFDIDSERFPIDIFTVFTQKFTGGAPIRGKLQADGRIHVPEGKWATGQGKVDIECFDCTFGDKGTQLRPMNEQQRRSLTGGLTLPLALKLGKCTGSFEIEDGVGLLSVSALSDHGALELDVEIQFRDPVGTSTIAGYARFKFSDSLVKQDSKLEAMQMSMIAARQDDGFVGAAIDGTASSLRVRLSKINPLDTQSKNKKRRSKVPPKSASRGSAPARFPAPAIPAPAVPPVSAPAEAEAPPQGGFLRELSSDEQQRMGMEGTPAGTDTLTNRMRIMDDVRGNDGQPPAAPPPDPGASPPYGGAPTPPPFEEPPAPPPPQPEYNEEGIPQPPAPEAPPPDNGAEYR